MDRKFDAIVIGTGQAGPSLANRLASSGQQTAIIERNLFGGTCVNTGCIPTKTLIANARAAHVARRGGEFGVVIDGSISVDMKKVKARKDEISSESRLGIEKWLRSIPNCTVITGHARFIGPRTVSVNGDVLSAERIFINVGGRASKPPIKGIDSVHFFNNSTMMGVDFLPKHLVVIGGSYVGLEFAQMYRRFGSEVTVVEMAPSLIHREDADVSAEIKSILEADGISIRTSAECIAVRPGPDGVIVGVDCDSGEPEVSGSHILMAVGRVPNTDDLGLDTAGIEVDARGYIKVDDELKASAPGVWALGDCNGKGAFTHTSYNDYEIVAGNLFDGDHRRVSDRITAYALYIDPPLGRAGMTEAEARQLNRPVLIGKRPMTKVGRAVERGESRGFMKVLIDATSKQILGASLLGIEGDEVIHSLLDVMYTKSPYTVIQRAMHIHPTVSELVPTMLGALKPLDDIGD